MRPPVIPLLLALVLPAALGTRASAQAPAPQPSPGTVVPSGVEVVTVDVLVLDRQGRPVTGLTAGDFTVKEDGRVQAITSFEPVVVPESAPSRPPGRVSTNVRPPSAVERTFVLVFDDANISPYSTAHAQKAVTDLVRTGLSPGDQVMIVPTAGGAWWAGRIPEDRDSLLAYVDRLEGKYRPEGGKARIADHEAMAIWLGRDPQALAQVARRWFEDNLLPEAYPTDREARGTLDVSPGLALIRAKAQETYRAALGRLRLTLDTVGRVAEALGPVRGRKNLLLVSEGFIMDPSEPAFREVVQAARRANAVVHFLDARGTEGALGLAGMSGTSAEVGRAVEESDVTTAQAFAVQATGGARNVALDTGGQVVAPTAGLAEAMKAIAREAGAYYLVGYTPQNAKRDGAFRKITVDVGRPGVDVRARRGYYAPKDGERRKEDPDRLDPQVRAGLDSPLPTAALPLRLASYVFGWQPGGKVPVLLAAEADVAALGLAPRDGKVTASFETYVVVHARDTGELFRDQREVQLAVPVERWAEVSRQGMAFRREFSLPPGVYQARLLVREQATGRLGTVRHEFEVPPPQVLRTSTPVLTDTFQAGAAGSPSLPVPVAHRTFRPGARLAYAYDVYGAAPDPVAGGPKVSAGYAVRRMGGDAVGGAPMRPLKTAGLERVSQVIVFTAPPEPGDYALVLQVRDEAGAREIEVVDPFRVSP